METILKTIPWQHQQQAFDFAKDKHAVMLAMDMGTGKSKVAIDLIVNRGHHHTLIVCPLSVIDVWPYQFEKHCSWDYELCILDKGSTVKRTKKLEDFLSTYLGALSEHKTIHHPPRCLHLVTITNYEAIRSGKLSEKLMHLAKTKYIDCVVLDESHRIKAPGGKTSWYFKTLSNYVPWRMCLTGTPMPHSPLDVYAQYRFLDRSIFGSQHVRFKNRYAVMGGFESRQVINYQNLDELHEKFYSIAFRVNKSDVLDLPEQMFENRYIELAPKARKIYASLEEHFMAEVDAGLINASNALTKLLRLQQCTSGFAAPEESTAPVEIDQSKYTMLKDMLSDLTGEPVVVFCRFRYDLQAVQKACKAFERNFYELSGQTKTLKQWQNTQSDGVLAVQIQSGGLGVDLTKACYAIYYSMGFSLGDYEQSLARLHRPGQTRPVTYYHLISRKTVDEKVIQAIRHKKNIVQNILKSGLT